MNDIRVKFKTGAAEISANTILATGASESVILAYGHNNTITAGDPTDSHAVTTTAKVPLWVKYSSVNDGSLSVGTGTQTAFQLGTKKWHSAAKMLTFDEFQNTIDLKQWTWVTLYFNQIPRVTATGTIDVWLERLFIDGNTGDWGDLFSGDLTTAGPGGKATNAASGLGQRTLFTVGGLPGADSAFEVEDRRGPLLGRGAIHLSWRGRWGHSIRSLYVYSRPAERVGPNVALPTLRPHRLQRHSRRRHGPH